MTIRRLFLASLTAFATGFVSLFGSKTRLYIEAENGDLLDITPAPRFHVWRKMLVWKICNKRRVLLGRRFLTAFAAGCAALLGRRHG